MSRAVLRRVALATIIASLLIACGKEQPATGPKQAPSLPTIVVAQAGGSRDRLFDGRVEGIEQTAVRAQTAGRVATVVRDVNDTVTAGALVLRLRGVEQRAGLAQAEAAVQAADAAEVEAERRYRRIADLYERKVVARAAFDEITALRAAAAARAAAARAARQSAAEAVSYADVTAPYGGTIAARHVQPGELVAPGAALFDIVAPGRLRVVVDVPQTVAASLRIDPRATVLSGDRRIAAAAVRVFGSVAPQSGTVRGWADLPADATGLMAGQFVGIALPSGGATELAVPPSALVERSEVTAVYVVAPDGSVALRQVRVGHRRADSVEILAGLSRGERVVTDPLAALRLLSGSGRNTRP